jgi:DNA-directed RNA polymerase specialized sigma24 family protein
MGKNYVNNATLLKEMREYKDRKKHDPNHRVPESIGKAVYQIATNLARSSNFAGYTFREEMVGDAIENVMLYIDNFDPEKSQNAFAYFTQICYYAFLRRIKEERKHVYTRFKAMETHFHNERHSAEVMTESYEIYDNMKDFISDFEQKMEEEREKNRSYVRSTKTPKNKKYGEVQFDK